MTEYRFGRPEEEGDILDFINYVFSQSARPHDFEKLLPKEYVYPGYGERHALALEDGRIRGAVAVLPMAVQINGVPALRGGYVGSVSVHYKARGKGYMKGLMAMQIKRAQEAGLDFLALGGQRQRYGYWGFERGGGAVTFQVNEANVRHALSRQEGAFRFLPVGPGDDSALDFIARMYNAQPLSCLRRRDRLWQILTSWGGVPYVILPQEGEEMAGYLIALGDRITELGLAREDLLPQAVKAWMQGKKNCSIVVPWHLKERIRQIKAFAEGYTIGDTEMIKVLNWERMLRAGFALSGEPLPEGKRTVEIQGAGAWTVAVSPQGVSVAPAAEEPSLRLTEREAVELFFSPLGAAARQDPLLRAWLPLAFSIPSADQF